MLAILACIAKQERVRLSERTLAGLAKARSQGRIGGRPLATRRASCQSKSGGWLLAATPGLLLVPFAFRQAIQ